ncbi:unnamed protein product [marine sediment metagenome]|uniref:Xylose isomerase-like TIM barrel domain-containing protein n=1 Tax=marine sediment metagenome TaxID=412755 RepID=X1PKJ0_9ZZZZ
MKKSIVISTQPTKFSALAFKEDFEKSIKKVAKLGFDGAELAVRNPKDLKVEDVINIIKLLSYLFTGSKVSRTLYSFANFVHFLKQLIVHFSASVLLTLSSIFPLINPIIT